MNSDAESTLRMLALVHLVACLPRDYNYPKPSGPIGADRYRRITSDRWAWPVTSKGTTVKSGSHPGTPRGHQRRWLTWALGCRDGRTIHRTDSAWNAAHSSSLTTCGGPMGDLDARNMTRLRHDLEAKANKGLIPVGRDLQEATDDGPDQHELEIAQRSNPNVEAG